MRSDELEGRTADVEAERAEDLEERAEDRSVGRVREDDDRLLLASARKPLVLALTVEDVTVNEAIADVGGREAEGEDGVVDGGAVAGMVAGHGVGEGREGNDELMIRCE